MPKATKKIVEERKKPSQERARETRELILSTGEKILEEKGYENFSTSAVAKRTGVSVGTLYQYFQNKESLVASIILRRAELELGLLLDTIRDFKAPQFEDIMAEIVKRHLAFHRERPDLQRLIVEEIPKAGGFPKLREVENTVIRNFSRFLSDHQAQLRVRDFDMAAFFILYSFKWLARTALTARPEYLHDKVFEKELVTFLTNYLVKKVPL